MTTRDIGLLFAKYIDNMDRLNMLSGKRRTKMIDEYTREMSGELFEPTEDDKAAYGAWKAYYLATKRFDISLGITSDDMTSEQRFKSRMNNMKEWQKKRLDKYSFVKYNRIKYRALRDAEEELVNESSL